MSTTSLRAVLFPPDRKKRIFAISVVGALAGIILFLVFFVGHLVSEPKPKAAAVIATKPTSTTAPSTAPSPVRSAPAPSAIPSIPTFELQPSASSQPHHHGGRSHTQAAATTPTAAPPPPPPSTKPGFLTVMCKPACDHVIDGGRDLGETPLLRHELSSGRHVLTLRIDASRTQRTVSVDVPEGENITIHPDLSQ